MDKEKVAMLLKSIEDAEIEIKQQEEIKRSADAQIEVLRTKMAILKTEMNKEESKADRYAIFQTSDLMETIVKVIKEITGIDYTYEIKIAEHYDRRMGYTIYQKACICQANSDDYIVVLQSDSSLPLDKRVKRTHLPWEDKVASYSDGEFRIIGNIHTESDNRLLPRNDEDVLIETIRAFIITLCNYKLENNVYGINKNQLDAIIKVFISENKETYFQKIEEQRIQKSNEVEGQSGFAGTTI